jgi:hypothetical protein
LKPLQVVEVLEEVGQAIISEYWYRAGCLELRLSKTSDTLRTLQVTRMCA